MLKLYFFFIGLLFSLDLQAQKSVPSVVRDTTRVLELELRAKGLMYSAPDKALVMANEALEIAEELDFNKGKSRCLNRIGAIQSFLGNYEKAVETLYQALKISEENTDIEGIAKVNINLGVAFGEQNDSKKAVEFYKQSLGSASKIKNNDLILLSLMNIGAEFSYLSEFDSSYTYTSKAYEMANSLKIGDLHILLFNLGNIEKRKKNFGKALVFYNQSIKESQKRGNKRFLAQTYDTIGDLYYVQNKKDSSKFFLKKALELASESKNLSIILSSSKMLSRLYEKEDKTVSLNYLKQSIEASDTLFKQENIIQIQKLNYQKRIQDEELGYAKKEFRNKQYLGIMASVVGLFAIISAALFFVNNQKSKSNKTLNAQKIEIEKQAKELNQTLVKLKSTQTQLIHKEKLASLGELTSGIAHEIQNPLNFVNNFSELSMELLDELKAELKDQNGLAIELLEDLKGNQEKIFNHGKRASHIVNNMLDHSGITSHEMSLTNLNNLVESFANVALKNNKAQIPYILNLDKKLPAVEVSSAAINRVLMNLINNSLYAINKKMTLQPDFKPLISISSSLLSPNELVLKIEDNGIGMNEKTREKIFQPFFTTKPTGEGTGLGLSLSYDIITKGHEGELTVSSVEGEGSIFTIHLPTVNH